MRNKATCQQESSSAAVSSGWAPPEEWSCNRPPLRCRRRCRRFGSPTRNCRQPDWKEKTHISSIVSSPFFLPACAAVLTCLLEVAARLPGLDVLRHDVPRQVIVTVVTPRVVKEIGPRGEDVTGKPSAALQDTNKTVNTWLKGNCLILEKPVFHIISLFILLNHLKEGLSTDLR